MHIKTIWKILTLVNKVAYNNYMKQNENRYLERFCYICSIL